MNQTPEPSIGQCHNCGKPLSRGEFVHNNQTGFAYCNDACKSASETASAPITLAQADANEAAAIARYRAFTDPRLVDVVTEARKRADAVARLDAALAAHGH